MKTAAIWLICLLSTSVLAPTLWGQGAETVDRKEIELLLELEYNTSAIIAYLEDENRVLDIDDVDLRFMQKRKVAPDLLAWLKTHLPKKKSKVTVDAIIKHWKTNKNDGTLRKFIKSSEDKISLSTQDSIRLMRAGVPMVLIKLIRAVGGNNTPVVPNHKKLTLDAIVLMAANGASEETIINAIENSNEVYSIDAARIIELKSDGLSTAIIRELFSRKSAKKKTTKVKPVETKQATSKPTAMNEWEDPTMVLFRDRGIGISMLKPTSFVSTKEFQGIKALVQLVAPMDKNKGSLPDLELSVMAVHPRMKSTKTITDANLLPIAEAFAQGLRDQFARDNINMTTDKPTHTWIGNRRALRIATQAQVTKTRVGYQGASYVLHDQGRIIVVSYSMRLEKSHRWRPILESCVQSIVFEGKKRTKPEFDGGSRREQVGQLFEVWRRSIRRLDFRMYSMIHYQFSDTILTRKAFLVLAQGINEMGNRVEIDGIDFDKNIINYNVFSVDGMSSFQLGFAKDGRHWVLTQGKAM